MASFFKHMFDLSRQRNWKQALGFYAFMLLMGGLLSIFVGLLIFKLSSVSTMADGRSIISKVSLVCSIVVCLGLASGVMLKKNLRHPLDLAALVFTLAFSLYGALFGLIPVAWLSTRPASEDRNQKTDSKGVWFFIFFVIGMLATPVMAEQEVDLPSPRNTQTGPQELIDLAKEGNVMAQFILGDIYSKGKAGVERDEELARQWFEKAAAQNHEFAFIRLAALAKKREDWGAAYAWYTRALKQFDTDETVALLERERDSVAAHLDQKELRLAKTAAKTKQKTPKEASVSNARLQAVYELNR